MAEALGGAVEPKPLRHTRPRVLALLNRLGTASVAGLDAASRAALLPPWPDLVIGAGWRSVPVARWIRRRSGGRARIVGIGRPRCHPVRLDLLVTTPQYGLPPSPAVLEMPFCLSRQTPDRLVEAARSWAGRLEAFPEPRLALLLGGDSPPFRLRPEDARAACDALVARAAALGGGSVLAVGSRRTTPAVLGAVRAALEAAPMPAALLGGEGGAENPYPGLLALADEITVTADSAAMISDAIAAGKPVGLVPVHPAGPVGAWLILARAARRGASSAERRGEPARAHRRPVLERAGPPRHRRLAARPVVLLARGGENAAWPARRTNRRAAYPPPPIAETAAERVRRLLEPPPAARAGRDTALRARAHRGGCGAP